MAHKIYICDNKRCSRCISTGPTNNEVKYLFVNNNHNISLLSDRSKYLMLIKL